MDFKEAIIRDLVDKIVSEGLYVHGPFGSQSVIDGLLWRDSVELINCYTIRIGYDCVFYYSVIATDDQITIFNKGGNPRRFWNFDIMDPMFNPEELTSEIAEFIGSIARK